MSKILIVDSIMGSGKSQSAISYMNQHFTKRFIYITPYLDEADRIKNDCPKLNFAIPNNKIPKYEFSKQNHTKQLLLEGRNIASTHAMFRLYDAEIITLVKKYNYILIIDEALDVFTEAKYSSGDIDMLIEAGYLKVDGDLIKITDKQYTGVIASDLYNMAKYNNLIQVEKGKKGIQLYYWALPIEVIKAFQNVFILTYLFKAQDLKYYFDLNNIEYRTIGVEKNSNGYYFSENKIDIKKYKLDLKNKIHIFENEKLNSIGRNNHDLSSNWFKRNKNNSIKLKNNMYNFFRYYYNHIDSSEKMWGTFKSYKDRIKGKGYSSGYVVFNKKATNSYSDKCVLAYPINIFVKPNKKQYFADHGLIYDEDSYALSEMIQWIWRSAIRNGKEIWIYIPSKRMRNLLKQWLNNER